MKNIVIYGAGGYGKEIACLINRIHTKSKEEKLYNILGFIDDGKDVGYDTGYGLVLGGVSFLNEHKDQLGVVLAIGNPSTIEYIVGKIKNENIYFPNIIAPNIGYYDKGSFKIGQGNIIASGCFFSCDVHIGSFNVFNGSITLGHDVAVGDFNVFMPGTRISGEVNIGNQNLFGVYSVVIQQVNIGNRTTVSPSSVIMRKTKDNSIYIGNPAKIFKF